MPRSPQTVTLIGAGLNGPLLALGLIRRGFKVEIYERRPDMRRVPISAGRSINLALSVRGIHALAEAGLWRDMRKIIIPMKGRMMHSMRGELTFQPYGKDESEVINSISRAESAFPIKATRRVYRFLRPKTNPKRAQGRIGAHDMASRRWRPRSIRRYRRRSP